MIDIFAEKLQVDPSMISYSPVGGGSINSTYKLQVGSRRLFCKINRALDFPEMFAKEEKGLELLRSTSAIRVPIVEKLFVSGMDQFLLMEYIQEGPRTVEFWKRFGAQLAAVHLIQESFCGLNESNYMGSLTQRNTLSSSWPDFFFNQRILPQVKLAVDRSLFPASLQISLEGLHKAIHGIFPDERFSLLHGDLWSGNFLCDNEAQPVLIDPAVYYGSRHMDLAMTTLFGGFRPGFYESYQYYYPFPADSEVIWDICNLYPLLVHLNLFGASYLSSIQKILHRF